MNRPLSLLLVAAALAVGLASVVRGDGPAAQAAPGVIRTMVHHQITSLDKGANGPAPVLSDNGNRAVFAANPSEPGPIHVAVTDFDGGNFKDLDAFAADWLDLSADGSRIVYGDVRELRIINADGSDKRTVLKLTEPDLTSVRICGDGSRIFFLIARDCAVILGGKTQPVERGVYSIAPDGSDFRCLVRPEDVARLRGIQPGDTGPNFRCAGLSYSLDVSHRGQHIAFGAWAKDVFVLLGCDGNGQNLHALLSTAPNPGGAYTNSLSCLAISADGNTVGYHLAWPDELGAVGFDGGGRRVLLKDDPTFPWGFDVPLWFSSDGARLGYCNCQFNTDGSGRFELMHSVSPGNVLSYASFSPAMDAAGRRYVYLTERLAGIRQLATMELDVPWDQLRGAPQISNLSVDPPAIPRHKDPFVPAKIKAAVQSQPTLGNVTSSGFRNGMFDPQISQTSLRDDGKTQGEGASGDEKAGDGIFTSRSLYAEPTAADGPRTLRIDAPVEDSGKLWHGSVVEIGPFPVVDHPPAGVTASSISGTPPAPPSVNPGPEATGLGGTASAGGGAAGGTTNGGGGGGPVAAGSTGSGGPAPAAPIDLTGFWKDDTGTIYDIRQIGTAVYWSMDGRPYAINVLHGALSGNTLKGDWVDLPGGQFFNTGTLTLRIDSSDRMVKMADSIPYGATTWTRLSSGPGAMPGAGGAAVPAGALLGPATVGGGRTAAGAGTAAGICANPRALQAMDAWLASASPPQQPGDSLRYESWGRLVGRTPTNTLRVNGPPQTPLTRCEYLWQQAAQLHSTNLGTLKDYVQKKLAEGAGR